MESSPWKKSSRSAAGGNCVEARLTGGSPQLSDSKLANVRPTLTIDSDTFTGFLSAIKAGALD